MALATTIGLMAGLLGSGAAAPPPQAAGIMPAPAQAAASGLRINLMRDPRIGGQRAAVLAKDWLYCYPPAGELILVPRGYVTDFASIPALARHIIEPYGDNAEGAVAHDWFYAVGEPGQRAKADAVLRQGLKEQGVGVITRNIVYLAVRAFGGASYGKRREWDRRFADPELGAPLPASPFRKRDSAVVGTIGGDCGRMEDPTVLNQLYTTYTSAFWPPADPSPQPER